MDQANESSTEEAALKVAWDFLENWTQTLSEQGASERLPEFLAAADALRSRMPEEVAAR